MKRELRFRAWIPNLKRIIYIGSHKNDTAVWICEDGFNVVDHFTGKSESMGTDEDGVILMQFTGLKDKNGREIYEGDILDNHYRVEWNQLHCGWALFNHKGYCHELLADEYNLIGETLPPWQIDAEVIGNIYENPELLKP